jgi:23S rRNA (guanine745-N1)-methyltransferase
MKHALTCPVCAEPLAIDPASLAKYKSVVCARGHLFDFAKQGYLNLLLSQHKKSKQPGDTLEMVQARTQFLNQGFYDSISNFLIQQCLTKDFQTYSKICQETESIHYCDLACGEGFYTQQVHDYINQNIFPNALSTKLASTGIDISTPAIKAASKRTKQIQWLISSLARIPLASNSQDFVTGLFFHFDLEEIKRILKPGAKFIMVSTGPNHLIELRALIYDIVKTEKVKDFRHLGGGLNHFKCLKLKEKTTLTSSQSILTLLAMTPHYWRCTQEKKQGLESLSELSLTLDIQFDIFIKSN